MDFFRVWLGDNNFSSLIALTLDISWLAFFIIITKRQNALKKLFVALLLITGTILAYQIKIPEERIHILEYMILGWFTGKDLLKDGKHKVNIFLACVFTLLVGVFDELFQKILPYRVFDMRDILFNSAGGTGGVFLYLLIR